MSPELNVLIEAILCRAVAEHMLVVGFVATTGDQSEFTNFTTARERGTKLALLYQRAAQLIEEKAAQGLLIEYPLQRPG